jgi:hypothetical protein
MAALEIFESDLISGGVAGPHLRLVEAPAPRWRAGTPVAVRRAARARVLQRRRRVVAAVSLAGALTFLAWPGHAFGGVNGAGLPTDLATSSTLASGEVYVVQPGDTVSSIAALINPLDPKAARSALVHELGSSSVVAGEHVLIP